ncbi:hypothetical protein P886_2125 [Alteromonadaceae bacterium 2753L.S.0a.02]|nr:hypothetical protein P886_2125 [Alteromonadaceae bacterium 2753L.S.0a.02]
MVAIGRWRAVYHRCCRIIAWAGECHSGIAWASRHKLKRESYWLSRLIWILSFYHSFINWTLPCPLVCFLSNTSPKVHKSVYTLFRCYYFLLLLCVFTFVFIIYCCYSLFSLFLLFFIVVIVSLNRAWLVPTFVFPYKSIA